MKRFLLVVLACFMAVAMFVGCDGTPAAPSGGGTAGAPDGPVKLGLSMQTQGAPYFVAQAEAFKEKCAELGIECVVVDAQGDMTKQQSDVDDMIAQGCTAIVINPCDAQGCVAVANSAMAQGIPVFIMDNSIDPSANYVSMIQSNNLAIGTLVGEWIAKQFGTSEIRIGMLSGNQGNLLGVDRRIGVIKGITEAQLAANNSTNYRVVTQGWGGWNQEDGLTAAEDMLTAAPDINVIVAENDSMGLGAVIALENAGLTGKVTVVGIDGQKEALALIAEGKYGASGLNDPVGVAYLTIETIMKYLGGDTNIPKLINTVPAVISADNVAQYYDPNSVF